MARSSRPVTSATPTTSVERLAKMCRNPAGAVVLGCCLFAASLPAAQEAANFDRVDEAIRSAVERGQAPGAVVVILHRGEVVHRKALGRRSVKPAEVVMTLDTVFDLASLTKPLATAASVLVL